MDRDIFLQIETVLGYSPLAPIIGSRGFGRDCMFGTGHEYGRLTAGEILGASLDALVYREYLDPNYTIPSTTRIIAADRNEPPWDRRVPGAVLYAKPGDRLHIHVRNADPGDCHSFHLHGLHYGIDSDGAWPFGVRSHDGRRSDEILPGQSWTYVFEAMDETIGPWVFHDHVRGIGCNINRGLFGGLIVRDPRATCADHEIPLFVHQMAGTGSATSFESGTLSGGATFSFTFPATVGTIAYHCAIHGPSMAGQVQVVSGGPPSANVTIGDNFFNPALATIGPGGTVTWTNTGTNDHIVFAPGGGTAQYCLNGRTYVGNTPLIVAEAGQRLRWYLFNMDVGDVWHNFHPHSARWQLPAPPGTASDVHPLSPAQSFLIDTEAPEPVRLPCRLEDLQCDPPAKACRVRVRADFLFHCHLEEHMMAGLAGLVRSRRYIWITDEMRDELSYALPYDDDSGECAFVDTLRCNETAAAPAGAMGPMPIDMSMAATQGLWELLPTDSRVLAVHAALMHTGRVLFFAGSGNDPAKLASHDFRSVVWDYEKGTFITPSFTPDDVFCAGQTFLPDGRLLVAGGTEQYDPFHGLRSAWLFDPVTLEWTRVADMADGRWYPALATLADGRVFALSGLGISGADNRVAEIYDRFVGWSALPASSFDWPLYPHIFLLRDGRLLYAAGYMGGAGGAVPGIIDPATGAFSTILATAQYGQRDQAASVMLPPAQAQRFLTVGGGDPATCDVAIIDMTAATPTYAPGPSANFARMHANAVILPDRTVHVSGGSGVGEDVMTAVLTSELYDPASGTWAVAATAQVPRLYHSVALLLPDGRVLTAGSNPHRTDDELRLELYHPPYLFRGPRPSIDYVAARWTYSGSSDLRTPESKSIKWVHLIRPMATTHSLDTEQRLVELRFHRHDGCRLSVEAPTEATLAPPGWYMLFIVDHHGVPSVAKWVHLTHG